MKKLEMAEGVEIQESDGEFILKRTDLLLEEKNTIIEKLKARVSELRTTVDRLEEARDNWHARYLAEAAKNDDETMVVTIEKLKEQLSHGDERKQEYLRRLEELDDWFND